MGWLLVFALLLGTNGAEKNFQKNKEWFKRLIRRLEIDDYLVRMVTLNFLFECGDRSALGPVRKVFKTTKDTDQKYWCACIMLRLGDRSAKKFLLEAFLSENERERYHAAAAFGRAKFKDKQVLTRIDELWRNDPVPQVKTVAAYALAALGDKKGEKFLLEKLKDEKWLARDMAAVLSGWLKLQSAFDVMKKLWPKVKAEDRKLAVAFAWGLAKFGHKEAMKYLVEKGAEGLTGQMAICELGPPMVPLLVGVLKDKKMGASVRRNAALLLGLIGDEKALKPLIEALSDKVTSVATASAKALSYTMHKKAVPPLLSLASNPESNLILRRAAVNALATLKDPSAIPALRSILLGESVKSRGAAAIRLRDASAAALAKIKHKSSAEALSSLLLSKSTPQRLIRASLYYIRKHNRKEKSILSAIIPLLEHKENRIKNEAHKTLKMLTGLDLPCERKKWEQAFKKSGF